MYKEKQQAVDNHFGEGKETIGLFPGFWQGKEYTGEQTYDEKGNGGLSLAFEKKYGGRTPDQLSFWEKITSTNDINPIFEFFYNTIPGGKGATLAHDGEMHRDDINDPDVLKSTIAPSFVGTWYSTIYGKYQGKIQDYINNKPKEKEQ